MESTILLVEPDPASQRVMEVSLKKVGFAVQCAVNLQEALQHARNFRPQLILAEANLPDGTGYDLCRHIRADQELAGCGVMIMSENNQAQARIDAITAGADEFMRKPVRIKEIVTRATALLERQAYETLTELDGTRNFSGTLEDIGLVDLLQLIETGKKTCIIHLSSDPKQSGGLADTNESGRIYCRDGQIIDSELKRKSGAFAVYRMMLWDNGVFEIEFTPLGRENIVQMPIDQLMLEGMRQVDQWTKIKESLPSLSIRLDVDYAALSNSVEQLPEEVEALIRLFDGHRSTRDVINEASILDIPALEAINRLHADGILYDKRTRPALPPTTGEAVSLNAWLSSAPPPRRFDSRRPSTSIPGLPSVLGRAMIPAVDSPSEILRPMTLDPGYPQAMSEGNLDDEPILLTDTSRKHSAPSQLDRPLSNFPPNRPRTLTAPPAILEQEIGAPPPAPPRTMSPASLAPPPAQAPVPTFQNHQAELVPAPVTPDVVPPPSVEVVPPSDEFASSREVQSSASAVFNQTVEKTVPDEPAILEPGMTPSAAHKKEDTAERFFRMYDEDKVAEAAGVGYGKTPFIIGSGLLIVGALLFTLSQDKVEETAKVEPAWPKAGGEGLVIESAPEPAQAAATTGRAESNPEAAKAAVPNPDPAAPATAPTTAPKPAPTAETTAPAKPEAAPSAAPEPKPAPVTKTPEPAAKKVVAKPAPKPKKVVAAKPAPKPKKALPRKASKKSNDPELLDRLQQAEDSLESKDWGAAGAAFRKVISMNKSNAKAHSGLALTLLSQGKVKPAIKSAKRALKPSKYRDARAYMVLGLGYSELEQDKKAIKNLKRFLKLAPDSARAGEIESFIEALEEEE